jgi:hypothetical protein
MNEQLTPQSLMASADSDEQFWGHVWALVNAAGQESQPDCTGQSATERKRYRAAQRKHARWLAARCAVRIHEPRAKEIIDAMMG